MFAYIFKELGEKAVAVPAFITPFAPFDDMAGV